MMPRRKTLALAVLPLSLLLGACQATTTLSVSESRALVATLEMSDDEGLAAAGATCADIDNELQVAPSPTRRNSLSRTSAMEPSSPAAST